jgi:ankyrin repeat protein
MTMKKRHLNRAFLDAIVASDHKEVQRLLSEGADPNARDSEHDQAAIILAASFGDREIVEVLIGAGAEVEAPDDSGRTALFFTEVGSEIFSTLISVGANINARDHEGNTILMNAVSKASSATDVEELLKLGVDPKVRNANGESAVDIATQLGLVKVIDLLESK